MPLWLVGRLLLYLPSCALFISLLGWLLCYSFLPYCLRVWSCLPILFWLVWRWLFYLPSRVESPFLLAWLLCYIFLPYCLSEWSYSTLTGWMTGFFICLPLPAYMAFRFVGSAVFTGNFVNFSPLLSRVSTQNLHSLVRLSVCHGLFVCLLTWFDLHFVMSSRLSRPDVKTLFRPRSTLGFQCVACPL